MDHPPDPQTPSSPTTIQHSWSGLPADARTERLLAQVAFITAQAIGLATAAHALALAQLAATPPRSAPNRPAPARQAPEDADPTLTFTRLFHLVTRAIVLETHMAEQRRTQDQRDRLTDHRASGAAELARRTCSQRSVRTLVADAIAAAGLPQADFQQLLNHRMFDPDIGALFADQPAAAIAAIICRDLEIPFPPAAAAPRAPAAAADPAGTAPEPFPPEPFPPEPFHDQTFAAALSPDERSAGEMDALLRSILTHPSLDRPVPPRPP